MKKLYFMLLSVMLLNFLAITAFAQKTITGTVRDAKGESLPAVSIKVKGTAKAASSDGNGKYTISAAEGNVIVFSYIGYTTKEITVGTSTTINVTLSESEGTDLMEVQVNTALGLKRPKKELNYAVSEIKGKDIVHAGTENLGSALIGKLAGVEVGSMAGGPMAGTRINIRGVNSLDGSGRPLLVLDGVPVNDSDDAFTARGSNGQPTGSLLNALNPDDIESMTVLRGANAAAIYGSQALNGAIVVTTKKGNAGQRGIGIDVSTNYTVNQITDLPKLQNEYGSGTTPYFTTFATDGTTPTFLSTTAQNFGPKLDGRNVQWWDGVVRPWVAQPDNYRDLFKNGYTNQNNLAFTGANDKGSFRLSLTNFNYGGFLENMKQTRNSVTFAAGYNLSKKLKIEAQLIFNDINNQNPPQRLDRLSNYPIGRNEITQLYEDNYKNALGYYMTPAIAAITGNLRDNLLRPLFWDQRENLYTNNQQQFLGSITGTYTFNDMFKLRLRGGTDRYFTTNEVKERWLAASNPSVLTDNQGRYSRTQAQTTRNYGEALFMFNKDINKDFKVSVNLGASIDDSYDYSMTLATRGLRVNDVFAFNNNKNTTLGLNATNFGRGGERYAATFGSAQLGFRDYLFLEMTARNDWSSRLPEESRSYFYPSVGLSFVLSDAVKLPEVISHAKIRTSYAEVGNTTPNRYFANENYTNSTYLQGDGTTSATTSFIPASVPPTNIVAEKNHSFEVGLETAYFKDRVNFDITYFNNKGVDLLSSAIVSPSSGASSLRANTGSLGNSGFEITIGADIIRTHDFTWHADFNTSLVKRKVIDLGEGFPSVNGNPPERVLGNPFNAVFKAVVGSAPYDIYMAKWPRNAAGQLIVNANGTLTAEPTLSYMGSSLPKAYGGLSNRFSYKGFDLQAMIAYRFGGKIVSFTNALLKASGAGAESLFGRDAEHGGVPFYTAGGVNVLYTGQPIPAGSVLRNDGVIIDGVKPDGVTKNDVIIPANTYYDNRYYNAGAGTEELVYKNDYIYLSEVSVNYNLPQTMVAKLGLQNISVGLVGRNLLWIYKSLPNTSAFSSIGTSGVNAGYEYTNLPNTRNIGFSLKAKF
ncbi:SusC/RagA family TonB-linked outer membrane protein [Pedobacter sp. MW01-1-1]|uniref:SusC/RagA family TonB-linked outer membrane protein n=1 Tax=Pedobacter sp. MW01-1-1 TaxID=3383027 RepID=UPI003FEEE33D